MHLSATWNGMASIKARQLTAAAPTTSGDDRTTRTTRFTEHTQPEALKVQAKEAAKKTACLSNTKQLGLGLQLYLGDSDDTMFFRSGFKNSRSGLIPTANSYRWWNLLVPYVKSTAIFKCPSDTQATASNDINGVPSIQRSYIAVSTAESLNLSVVPDPTDN